ncbi:heavy metal translocating P-type ATPase [Massilia sp. G4R7]|uniref:P-type Zn(2+) transporter n=1 Tax=Massilia phyllostachyos TaxID=2898585 RepID=A0ABS8Q4R8_9BURK|nr:heavy metal translocating P-type ATPase [Massilia phyllostachyos]MCD2516737.1 heavy metal translocating P-type ATPase [Massilia phyllostachyos]
MSDCQNTSCCSKAGATEPIVASHAQAEILPPEVLQLRIEQMDCPTEEGMLRQALGRVPGVAQLDFNLVQRKLRVVHHLSDQTPIIAAIRAAGMEPLVDSVAADRAEAGATVFRIENMDCPTEEALIRSKLGAMPLVERLDFNLVQRRLAVHHSGPAATIEQALKSVGMQAVLVSAEGANRAAPQAKPKRQIGLIFGLLAAIAAEVVAWSTGLENSLPVILLALAAIATTGLGVYKKGWISIKNRNLNINALMSIAVTGAVLIGQWPEAAMVMVLFAIAEMIEAKSLDRARNAIQSLMTLAPETLTVRQPDGSWSEQQASVVGIGSIARVSPGERIALDGEVVSGQSSVNQAPITGESIPVSKGVGDKVFAGTVNETGSFEYRVTATHGNSTLARIIHAVEEAQGSRAPTQRFVDRFSSIYTPAVFAIALAVALVPPLMLGGDWLTWIYKALVMLVIACPCALVISTPVTIVSALTAAARAGILIKGGVYLEQGAKLRSIALDKTGTITQGRPEVTDVVALSGDADHALYLAASLADRSDHPVSGAVSQHWRGGRTGQMLASVVDFEALTGRGTKGRIDGKWYFLGNHRLIEELGICNSATEEVLARLENEGKTAVVLCDETAPRLAIGVADTVRESSKAAIAQLQRLGVRTVMLTGDNAVTAAAIARQVGIDDARGNLLPEDKLAAVAAEGNRHGTVGMVGDGINDAPALAKADIGFAMGAAGTDTAIETADVALMDDDLRKIAQFIRLSRRAAAVLRQNIALALLIKAVFLVLALAGKATLWMAVFADMGASLLVVLNGLRLLTTLQAKTGA